MVKKKQQTEKKKPAIFRRILKWIGLGLLVLLLIASLIFQAPWKVIALLLIILAACTVLPKPARKWFWLSVAAIVLVLIIWVFLPDDSEGWRPYTFDEELAALEAKYAIPDSENTATIYNQLLEDHNEVTFEPDFLDPNLEDLTRKESWSSQDYPKVAQWLKQHEDTIAKLIEASKIENCRLPIVANTIDMVKQTDRLSAMRRWAFLLVRAGNNDMAEGRIEEGLEKYLCVKKIGGHMQQQSSIVEILVGMAVEDLALSRFKAFVITADATEEHLNIFEKAVTDITHDWNYDFPRILECEKLMAKNMWTFFYEVNPEGRIRFSRDPYARMRNQLKERLDANQTVDQKKMKLLKSHMYPTYWKKKYIKAGTILGWFFMPSTPQKVGEIIDGRYGDLYAMIEPDFDWQREPPELPSFFAPWNFTRIRLDFRFWAKLIVGLSKESYYGIHDQYLRNIAKKRGTLLIIALRRYKNENGQWPETLDSIKDLVPAEILVDPINGGSFVYKLTEENFTLYSIGKNNIDEDGKYRRRYGETSEGDDWLIWPPKTRETKNVKADVQQSNTQKEVVK